MGFGNMFLLNLAMLVTVAYLVNVFYKYGFKRLSRRTNYFLSIIIMILSGWICMKFGFQVNDDVIFDLRFVPLIIASVTYSNPLAIIVIGTGIGLARLTFGITDAAMAGFINLSILGLVCAGLNVWMKRSQSRFAVKGIVTILVVNVVFSLNSALFGVFSFHKYMFEIMPIVFPLSVLLSLVFAFILRDFQLEHRQYLELMHANELLMRQTDELHKAKIGLEDRAKQLSLASSYKSEFLANMSHELRTPLNSIINLAQIIAESEDAGEDLSEYGRIIYKSGYDLLQLINDILDLSKVEAGRLEITNEEVVLAEVANWMQIHFEHIALQKNIRLEINREEGLPDTIISDPQRIAQILRNLLSNAFKFTHEGYVQLAVRRALPEEGVQGDWVVFSVTDTGIGVPKEKQSAVFEVFQQADGSISRKYGGTGLGLPISSNLARLLGGFIRLESEVGQGSEFSLYLPLKPGKAGEEAKVAVGSRLQIQ